VSIVRVGLSENKSYAEGYDLIFGAKKGQAKKEDKADKPKAAKKAAAPAKKATAKKKKKAAKKKS
jgi:hypothetical protein